MEPLTIRIQFFGLHSQVIPGVEFSVQFFLIVNVPLLGYLEELALVTGPTDGVSVDGRDLWLSTVLCQVQTPGWTDEVLQDLSFASFILFTQYICTLPGIQSSKIIPSILAVLPSPDWGWAWSYINNSFSSEAGRTMINCTMVGIGFCA